MDVSVRAISSKHNIKISIVDISESMREITELQGTNPIASVALSRVTAANTLLGLELKNGEMTTSNITTQNGLARKIIAELQGSNIRSYIANPTFDPALIDASKDPIKQVIGTEGTLILAQSMLNFEPYVSQVALTDASVDLDYMNYIAVSNQVKSFIATSAELDDELKIKKVIGILIQLFPEHTDEDIDYLDAKIGSSDYICNVIMKSTNYTAVIEEIADDAVVLETKELNFKCSCSREKTLVAIKMLGKEELQNIIEDNENIEVVCDFCKTKYEITIDEIKELI